jgi:hypothetical protein
MRAADCGCSVGAVRGRGAVLCGLVAAVLVTAGVASASSPNKEKIAYTAAGQAEAKAEVLKRADVGSGWSGGVTKPDVSSTLPCSYYKPKQNDLVLIGAAETDWRKPGYEIDAEAQVLRTADMVRRDWQRTVLAPQVVPCLRQGLAKSLGNAGSLDSFGRVAFPRVAALTQAFRAVFKVSSGSISVPVETDVVAIGAGRNELTLTLTGLVARRSALHAAEVRFARQLAGRMRP